MRKLVILRRISQAVFFIFFVYILWSTTYPLRGLFSPQVLFKIDPLIMFMTALSERILLPGLIFALLMVLMTFVLGRFFCGWVCPMGSVIDWSGALQRKKGQGLERGLRRALRAPKFIILALIVVLAFLGIQAAWVLDPIVTAARVVSLSVIPGVTMAVEGAFQFVIQRFGLYGGLHDFFRYLKDGFLGVNAHFFDNSLITLVWFLLISFCSIFVLRLWCRMLCPLGAWYAVNAAPALLQRRVGHCTTCGNCVRRCRMGAIETGKDYQKGECILCMDCVYDCPEKSTAFTFQRSAPVKHALQPDKGLTRGQFLWLFFSGLFLWLAKPAKAFSSGMGEPGHPVIRPPAALPEGKFVDTCVRCGNCMKVCITNGLQPVVLESGVEGLWTPQLVPEIGYCEYKCTLCGEVCPTGAIKALSEPEKKKAKLGLAEIDHATCLAWDGNEECIVCEEHCPVAEKAIKTREEVVNGKKIFRPSVDAALCVGCGICQNKCPVRPLRAIRVNPRKVS
jgi:MauM/NapG family ferredoxin protein